MSSSPHTDGGVNAMLKKILCAAAAIVLLCAAIAPAYAQSQSYVALPILMYHHISVLTKYQGAYVVSPETFEGDLKYLSDRGYTTVDASDLLAWVRGERKLPAKPVMITFDDGQLSFAEYALPLLEKYGMKAVFNVVGRYADTYTEKTDENVNYAYCSWPKLAELAASSNVELGVHSYDMHRLGDRRGCGRMTGESDEAYAAALNADLDKMEARWTVYLNARPVIFAYPFGVCNDTARWILASRGYQVAFTCQQRVNRLTGDASQLMDLSRFNRPNGADRARLFAAMGVPR